MRISSRTWLTAVTIAASFEVFACTDDERATPEGVHASEERRQEAGEHAGAEGRGEHAGSEGAREHARSGEHGEHAEHGEHGSGEGEESGEHIAHDETWDASRNGVRLVLAFDRASNAFVGTVENTTGRTLCAVRVEVHLSSGTELGPSVPSDLLSGAKTTVRLPTTGEAFHTWTAHPEVSTCTDM